MSQTDFTPEVRNPQRGRWGWLRALLIGVVLFVITTVVMFLTGNPNLYPTVILIGNFLVPIVFVAFLYDHQHISSLSLDTVAASFCIGGILVGLIEEGCKIAVVIFLARKMRHNSQMDGLLLGGAVGMGFAALESTGYAFTAFLLSNGNISASLTETVLRGLLTPFGHGIWTGILGAVLFRESAPHRFHITGLVILTYLFVSFLHGLWDGLPVTLYITVPPGFPIPVTSLIIGVIGVVLLSVLYRRAMKQQKQQSTLTLP